MKVIDKVTEKLNATYQDSVEDYIKGKYDLTTPDGRLTYFGVVIKYFMAEFGRFETATKIRYGREYETKIFPYFSAKIAVDDISEDFYYDVEAKIPRDFDISKETSDHMHKNLITRLVVLYFDDPSTLKSSPFLCSSSLFFKKHKNDDYNEVVLKIPKSISPKNFKNLFEYTIANPKTDEGELPGIGASEVTGIRLSEAAGASYRSIIQCVNFLEKFMIVIIESTKINKIERKIGSKTSNAIRRLWLLERYKEFIMERIKFLESVITFPIKDNLGNTINDVYDLPLSCRGNKYNYRVSSNYLSKKGKELLLKTKSFDEDSLSAIEAIIKTNEEFVEYKDCTSYVLRRNWLTNMAMLGCTEEQIEYWAGHDMEDSVFTRGLFGNDDNLYKIYKKIDEHPVNKKELLKVFNVGNTCIDEENLSSVLLNFKEMGKFVISIKENELEDGVEIKGEGLNDVEESISLPYSSKPNETINIIRFLTEQYNKK